MIRALRVRHRAIFALLAVLVPAGFGAMLLGRPSAPPASAWPGEPAGTAADEGGRLVMWSTQNLLTRIRRAEGTLRVSALSWSEPAAPALALYWSASEPRGELPDAARFVGALGPASRELELRDAPAGGWLVLYSLGHGEVLGELALAEDG